MKPTVFSLILLCVAMVIPSLARVESPGRERTLLGTWHEEFSGDNLRGVSEKTFLPGGAATGTVKFWKRGRDGKYVLAREFSFKSRWRIEGDVLVSYDVHTKPEGMIDPKIEMRDVILSLEPDTFRYKAANGSIGVYKKKA